MVDINKNPSWFRTASRCQYSRLPVSHPEMYISSHPGANYFVDIAKLGDRILLVKGNGYVHSYEMSEYLAFMDDYISNHFDRKTGFVYLDDYLDVEGSDSVARKKYINHYRALKRSNVVISAMLYNQPLLWQISYKIARRIHLLDDVYDTKTYEQSVSLALEIISRHNVGPVPGQDQDSDFLGFLEQSSEKAKRFYRYLTEQISSFKTKPSFRSTKKIQRQYSEALLRYIESIDWHREGIDALKIFDSEDKSVTKVFNAVNYIKSDIDALLGERDAAEKVLRESEARYRQLVEHAQAGIIEFDYSSNRITSVNDSFLGIIGYSKEEICSMNPLDLMTEESRKIFNERLSQRLKGKILSPDISYQLITKSARKLWILINANVNYEEGGQPRKADIVLIDITHLKEVENKLISYQSKLRQLSVQLSRSEESQRRQLASRLHESVSQELFAAQLKVNALEKLIDDPKYSRPLEEIRDQIVKSIKDIRGITYDLSPPVLYDLGLKEALESLAKSISAQYHLPVKARFNGPFDQIDDEIKIITYRVIREIVQNAIKHSRASFIDIIVDNKKHTLSVDVADNGVGFDADSLSEGHYSNDGFGIFDIREKINHLGGRVVINSVQGSGTRIGLSIPLKESTLSDLKN